MEQYDVLVVGAGPSGSAAARKCTDGGLKTLQIDKQKLPRRKACSGIIANVTQNYVFTNFGPIPDSAYGTPYVSKGMAMHFPSFGTIFSDCDCYNLYVWRDKFDYFLAENSGAKLEDQTSFVSLKHNEKDIEVTVKHKGKKRNIRTKYLIGADGGRSKVILRYAPEVYSGMQWVWACQKYFEGTIDANEYYLYWFLEKGFGPMPWLNIKDGQIIIGLAHLPGYKFSALYANLIDYLKKNLGLKIKRELTTEGCYANTMTPMNRFFPGRGRVLMAGDAMGLQHQGGEGISCGMISGGYAGQAILEDIKGKAEALPLYKKLMTPEIETCLDQFNPLRMTKTTASGSYRQPPFLRNFNFFQKTKMLGEAMSFVGSEFGVVKGMLPVLLKNTVRRSITGKYKIGIVE